MQKGRLLAACDLKQGGLARADALFMRIQFFHGYDRNMYGGILQKWLMHTEYTILHRKLLPRLMKHVHYYIIHFRIERDTALRKVPFCFRKAVCKVFCHFRVVLFVYIAFPAPQ